MPFYEEIEVTDLQPRRHADYKGVRQRAYGANSKTAEFIAWDGEGTKIDATPLHHVSGLWIRDGKLHEPDGSLIDFEPQPQPYVLLANSKGERITRKEGLRTTDCFRFMLDAKQKHPNSIFVGFGFNYDINQILADMPMRWLKQIHQRNEVLAGNYWVKWLPRKFLNITQIKPKPRRSVIVYDTFGFFQSSFLEACRKYLGEEDLAIIERGKSARSVFTWEELEEFIIPYNNLELDMLVRMMDILRADLAKVGVFPSQWHGPGAVATQVLKKYKVKIQRDIPKGVNRAAQFAMAGGRFELYGVGYYRDTVYEYDLHSAYPAAATHLPDLSEGYWEHVTRFEPGSFGVWLIDFVSSYGSTDRGPKPLFCRSEHGSISYPNTVRGWYWTPEATLCASHVQEGFVFRHRKGSTTRPFLFIESLYQERMGYKKDGNSAERALKLILNSLYGKTAQTVGGKQAHPKGQCWEHGNPHFELGCPDDCWELGGWDHYLCPHLVPPRWHQLEYAGYITSYTRAKMYKAIMLNPDAIIAAETDAVFSKERLDLPLTDKLGDWELKEYKSIVYLQSGFYYADTGEEAPKDTPIEATSTSGTLIKCRFRGLDSDRETKQPIGLPYRTVLDHLDKYVRPIERKTPALYSNATRYIGLGLGIRTASTWRSWETIPKAVSIDGNRRFTKRFHLRKECPNCQAGETLFDSLHPLIIGGYEGKSYARSLPWITDIQELEMDDSDRQFGWDVDRFQP